MRRRKKHPEHVNHERWLVSYADFITLLFAFFVVLYASSQVDKRKVGQLALAIQVAFQKMGVFEASNSKIPLATTEPMPFQDVQAIENVVRTQDLERFVQVSDGGAWEGMVAPGDTSGIQADLEKALAPEIRRHVVEIAPKKEGLVITLREIGFYESGSATIRPSSKGAIDRLISVLRTRTETMRIEGHTDNVPIHNTVFDSNWELSTARATQLIKLFIEDYGVSPTRLAAVGYAEYHPVDTNTTAAGRSHNRRVDIVVLNPSSPYVIGRPVAKAFSGSEEQKTSPPSTKEAFKK